MCPVCAFFVFVLIVYVNLRIWKQNAHLFIVFRPMVTPVGVDVTSFCKSDGRRWKRSCAVRGRVGWGGVSLKSALLVIAEIVAVADDDVVEEMDAHHLTCLLHPLCQLVVGSAWYGVAAGVVVADGKYGGVF